jgi:glycoprotein-N-acetylgalactosamine 3-beta-galactosyltransferase
MEDVMIARCLKDVFDIGLVDTRDSQDRERFHPFSPGSHYSWDYPIPPARDWYESYNRLWPIKLKEQCCAPDSVSFHYMKKPAMVRHLHSLLYFCD